MIRFGLKALSVLLVCLAPALVSAQVRTTGQVVGVVKDATGAVIEIGRAHV